MKYSEQIENFLTFLRESQLAYKFFAEQEKKANEETQDLLHTLELCGNSYHDLARISKSLTNIRRTRRDAKNRIEQLQPIVDWADQNGKTVKELERILGIVRKAEKNVSNRIYTPRTDIVERTINK